MTNYELGQQPVGLRRGRVEIAAVLGDEPLRLNLRSTDARPPMEGIWAQHGTGYLGMFNRPVADLPPQMLISVARADGSPFPATPPVHVSLLVGQDGISWTLGGLGGMPIADLVSVGIADEWITFSRPAGATEDPEGLTREAAAMAAAARRVLGMPMVPEPQRAHVVVVVDPSGSMKTNSAMRALAEVATAITGIHAVLGGRARRLEWHLAGRPLRRFESPEFLLASLSESPYRLGITLDLPDVVPASDEPTVVYLVTDELPGGLATFADIDGQARHLVVVANSASAPARVGHVDITVWPRDPADEHRLTALAKDLLRGCFAQESLCGKAVAV